jgi:quercetin dioxygenase-like cupin family protein
MRTSLSQSTDFAVQETASERHRNVSSTEGVVGFIRKRSITLGATACLGLATIRLALTQPALVFPDNHPKERARVVLSQQLSKMDGNHLTVSLVEVNYGPGEASAPHSHPCAAFGYVVAGNLRTQIEGEPEIIYKRGATFYEPPNRVHLVSANASTTQPAKLLAYLICDHDGPLSIDRSATTNQKGSAQ